MAKKHDDQEFRESLPMYIDSRLFTAADEEPEVSVEKRMVRQLLVLVALLAIQVILFVILIRSAINL